MFPYYYIDYTYIVFILPAMVLALWAQYNVKSTYEKYSRVGNARGLTGAMAARMILDGSGLHNVAVEQVQGKLSDHYDPRADVVRLSPEVYNSPSISSVGIAAHECGHAIQHAEHYAPVKLRTAVVPITNIGSNLAIPLLLVGILFGSGLLITIGIFGYVILAAFQLITLPVEFNASSRALRIIGESYLLEGDEQRGAKKVLTAAALTYVAALAASVAQLARLVVLFGGGNRRGGRR